MFVHVDFHHEQVQRSVHSSTDGVERGVLQFFHGSVTFWDMSNKVNVLCLLILQMLIFSLGRTLQGAVKSKDLEGGNLEVVLQSMVHPNPVIRATLMDLFDVSKPATPVLTDEGLMFVILMENLDVWFTSSPYCTG
jgi:hypothetical protein